MTFSSAIPAKKSTPQLLRMGHLMAFVGFLRQNGVPVSRYLHRHELPTQCEDPDTFVPFVRMLSLFETLIRREDRNIGWLFGGHVNTHSDPET